jgi:hypothetical protein
MTVPAFPRPTAAQLQKIQEIAERTLSAQEFAEMLAVPYSEEERRSARENIRWFCRRYKTAGERLAWARRAYARCRRSLDTEA